MVLLVGNWIVVAIFGYYLQDLQTCVVNFIFLPLSPFHHDLVVHYGFVKFSIILLSLSFSCFYFMWS
jgi:hypothetical protein